VNDTTVIGKAGNFNIAFRPAKLTSHAGAVLFKDLTFRF
jgi:hypothetical protein